MQCNDEPSAGKFDGRCPSTLHPVNQMLVCFACVHFDLQFGQLQDINVNGLIYFIHITFCQMGNVKAVTAQTYERRLRLPIPAVCYVYLSVLI